MTVSTDFINLTPHPISLRPSPDAPMITIATSGVVLRADSIEVEAPSVGGMPSIYRRFGGVDVPSVVKAWARTGKILIVSAVVLEAATAEGLHEAAAMVAPDSGSTAIRDEAGRVVAATRLVRATPRPALEV